MTANAARAARIVSLACLALLVPAVLAFPVIAAEPPVLSGQLTDIAERLVDEEDGIRAALDELREQRDITLYVVTLDAIDGEDPAIFADGIAAANGLGPREAVLFVSFGDRQFGMWTGGDLGVGPERIDELLVVLGDDLRAGDVAGGVVGAAANLERLVDGLPVIGGGGVTEPTDEPIETAPTETFPEEPPPPFEEPPIEEPGDAVGEVDGGAAALAVGVVGAAVAGGAALIVVRRRKDAIAGLVAEADALASRAADAAKAGTDGVDALAFGYGEPVAAPFRDGTSTADATLATVRSGRARLAGLRGLDVAPRQTIVRELEQAILPLEAWARGVAEERQALDDLSAVADERTAELVDGLPGLRERHASVAERVAAFAVVSPSAHATAGPMPERVAGLLGRLEDRTRSAAASLAAARRPAAVLALREAQAIHRDAVAGLTEAEGLDDRVDRASAERTTAAEEATRAIDIASAMLEASPVAHLGPRLAAAREQQARAALEPDVLVAWEASRQAAHEAGSIGAEVEAARRAATEAVDLATTRLATTREYVDHHGDVSSWTRDLLDELGGRLQALLGSRPRGPLEVRDAARAIAESIDQVHGRARQEVASAQAERDRRHRSAFAASSASVSGSSSDASASSSSSSSGSSAGSGHGGGSSSGGSW